MNIRESLDSFVKSLPATREFADMRYYLLKAINESEKIDKNRDRKSKQEAAHQAIAQQWKFNAEKGMVMNPFTERTQLVNALSAIDEMINAEILKIEQLKVKPQKQQKPDQADNDMITD